MSITKNKTMLLLSFVSVFSRCSIKSVFETKHRSFVPDSRWFNNRPTQSQSWCNIFPGALRRKLEVQIQGYLGICVEACDVLSST